MSQRLKALTSVGAFFCFVLAMSCGSKTTSPAPPAAATVSSVTVSAASIFTGPGQQVQFAATAAMSDGTAQNVSGQASWQSSNTAVLTVSSTGLASSIAEGDARLTATYTGVAGSSDVAVRIQWSLKGRLLSAGDGTPITSGVALAIDSAQLTSLGSDGAYTIQGPGAPASKTLIFSGPTIVTRTTTLAINGARTGVDVSLISLASPFSLTFYRELVRGSSDNNGLLAQNFRWESSPSFYINTRNGSSEMPAGVVADLAAALPALVAQVSDGRLSVPRIETGTETRPTTPGWINIEYTSSIGSCGLAAVGGNLARINPICSDLTFVGLHEVTHALGFWHHTQSGGLMSRVAPSAGARGPSALEAFHMKIAFSRPRGNTDPDNDPVSRLLGTIDRGAGAPLLACGVIR